jgi:hypothetical protein
VRTLLTLAFMRCVGKPLAANPPITSTKSAQHQTSRRKGSLLEAELLQAATLKDRLDRSAP